MIIFLGSECDLKTKQIEDENLVLLKKLRELRFQNALSVREFLLAEIARMEVMVASSIPEVKSLTSEVAPDVKSVSDPESVSVSEAKQSSKPKIDISNMDFEAMSDNFDLFADLGLNLRKPKTE